MTGSLFNKSVQLGAAGKLPTSDIYVGSIDATDEITISGEQNADAFFETYYIPEHVIMDDFLDGKMLFTYGFKGTGKTALLRYIGQHIKRSQNSRLECEFFGFRKEFPREIYSDLRTAYFKAGDDQDSKGKVKINIFRDLDYEEVWEYIFLNRVYKVIKSDNTFRYVKNTDARRQFVAYMESIQPSSLRRNILKFLPNISNGKVTISRDPSIQFDFDFDDDDTREVSFSKYMEKIRALYRALPRGDCKYYILIDEIDPRIGSGHLFHLDLILIRDLVVAVRNLNAMFPQESRGFIFIAAIRTEVLHSISTLGKDVHKTLEQFGVPMNWGDESASIRHPLIKMITKKILYSEKKAGILHNEAVDQEEYVWSRYFKRNSSEALKVKEFLDETWMRPRDVVRRLKLCQQQSGGQPYFSEQTLNRTRKQYANQSWSEIEAQLSAFIDPIEIDAVKRILVGFKRNFNLNEFKQRVETQKSLSTEVARLNKREADILEILYKNGIIGNTQGRGFRFLSSW